MWVHRLQNLKLPEELVDVLHVVTAELRALLASLYSLSLAEQSIREHLTEALLLRGDIFRHRQGSLEPVSPSARVSQKLQVLAVCWHCHLGGLNLYFGVVKVLSHLGGFGSGFNFISNFF